MAVLIPSMETARDVKVGKKKWNNLKNSAKVDCSCREVKRTGGGPNETGEVEDEDILFLSSDKEKSTSVTRGVDLKSFLGGEIPLQSLQWT